MTDEPKTENIVMSQMEMVLVADVKIGFLTLDNAPHTVLVVKHPRYGQLHFQIAPPTARDIRDWLNHNFPEGVTRQ